MSQESPRQAPGPNPPQASRPRAAASRWLGPVEAAVALTLSGAFTRRFGTDLPGLDVTGFVVTLLGARFGYGVGALSGIVAGVADLHAAGQSVAHLLDPAGGRQVLLSATVKVLLGVIAGLVGDAHRGATRRARGEADGFRERLAGLSRRYKMLAEAKEALDRRVVGQFHTVSSLYEAAKELEVPDPAAIGPAGLRLTARFLEAEAVAFYELTSTGLQLVEAIGENPDRPRHLPAGEGLIGLAFHSRKAAAVHTKAEHQSAGAVLAAPILDGDGRARGVLVVERLPFIKLTPDAIAMLELIADWTSRALRTSEAFAAQQSQGYVHPVTGIHQSGYMMEQLNREWRIAKRYELPLSIVLIRQPSLLALPSRERDAATARLAGALRSRIRQIDQVGHYRTEDSFLMILPCTPLDKTRGLVERWHQASDEPLAIAFDSSEGRALNPETVLQRLQAQVFPSEVAENAV